MSQIQTVGEEARRLRGQLPLDDVLLEQPQTDCGVPTA